MTRNSTRLANRVKELEAMLNSGNAEVSPNEYLYTEVARYCRNLITYASLHNKHRTEIEQTDYQGIAVRSSRKYKEFDAKISQLIEAKTHEVQLNQLASELGKSLEKLGEYHGLGKMPVSKIINNTINKIQGGK